ncbi:hypothetical protein Cadr_000028719 [Camelus dromedarius]|uniref:Uncharacterized protein n=1 Tax=Camelus dromedarius TaxID=9838 RepID=A0A5N4C7A0_CAMDR|nr:hypothetical protein Cadr_000028719 [Camelus dromedarius]
MRSSLVELNKICWGNRQEGSGAEGWVPRGGDDLSVLGSEGEREADFKQGSGLVKRRLTEMGRMDRSGPGRRGKSNLPVTGADTGSTSPSPEAQPCGAWRFQVDPMPLITSRRSTNYLCGPHTC